jgi:hypothetical protein
MATLTVPRLELWSDLGCIAGADRLDVAGFISEWSAAESTDSDDGEESTTYSIPLTAEAANVVREGHVTRLWRSDTDYEEWLVRKVSKRRDTGGRVDVVCGPVSYRLAEHGFVPEWQITDPAGDPLLDVGVAGLTLTELFQTYLIDNPKVRARLPFLGLGPIAPTVEINLEWSHASAQAVINAAVAKAQQVANVPYLFRLVRNANVSYDITVSEVV